MNFTINHNKKYTLLNFNCKKITILQTANNTKENKLTNA